MKLFCFILVKTFYSEREIGAVSFRLEGVIFERIDYALLGVKVNLSSWVENPCDKNIVVYN